MNTRNMYTASFLLVLTLCTDAWAVTQWTVKSGDTLYSILKQAQPQAAITQDKLREIVKQNPQAFENGNPAKPIVGATLNLDAKVAVTAANPTATNNGKAVGRVVVTAGNAAVNGANGRRVLQRNTLIYEGDTVSTQASSHTQIRFVDGALVALRPSTEFQVKKYSYSGQEDGSESSFFELAKGGFRTITGAIGHVNKNNYRVTTPVATIGIRGTHYGVTLCQDDNCKKANLSNGLYGGVVDGEIVVENETGNHTFSNDEYFTVAGLDQRPASLLSPPPVVFDGDELQPENEELKNKKKDEAVDKEKNKENSVDEKEQKEKEYASEGKGESEILVKAQQAERPTIKSSIEVGSETTEQGEIRDGTRTAPEGALGSFSYIQLSLSKKGVVDSDGHVENVDGNTKYQSVKVIDIDGLVVPVAMSEYFVDGKDNKVQRKAAIGKAKLADLGGRKEYGVTWGRWSGNYFITENDVEIAHGPNLHFIYSERMASADDLSYMGKYYGAVVFSYDPNQKLGGGTNPTDNLGNVGTMNSASVTIDFNKQAVTGYDLGFVIDKDQYNLYLVNEKAVSLAKAMSNNIGLEGSCAGSRGSNCGADTTLAGQASILLLNGGDRGMPVNAVASTFSVQSTDKANPNVTAQGAVLMEYDDAATNPK
ncbi:MAG: FecR domain-containing protein [Gammaproteobacteria bacterium]|nr:FecR domain-containing protein [Gammaproteobacteria bacterium]